MGEAVSRVCQGVCGYQSTQQNKQAQSSIQKKSSLLVQQLKGSETTRNDLEYKNQRDLSPNQQNFKTPLAVAGKFKGRSLSQKNLSLSQSNGNYLQTTGCKEIVSLKENNFTPEDFMTRFQDLHSESSSELSVSERDSEYIFRHLQRISNVSNRNTQFSEAAGGNTKQKKSKKLSILQRGRKSTFNIQEFQGRVEKQFQEKEGLIEGAFKLTAHSIVVRSMSCMSVYNLPSGRINSKYHVFELNRRHSPLIQLMPGRQQAVSAGKDGRIALWDIKAGGRAFSINNIFNFKYSQQCFFTDLAVLSRSSIIVLVQKTAQLMKINVKQGKIQKSTSLAHYFGEQDGLVDIQEEKIPKLYVFKDQFNMLALSGERYAIFIQLRSLKFVKKINFPEQTEVRTLMLMRDTNLLFVGALFDIILISFTTQRVCSTVRAHKSYITCLKELDIKKKLFASGSVDKSVKIWSLVESSCQLILLRTLDAHSTRIDQIMRMDRFKHLSKFSQDTSDGDLFQLSSIPKKIKPPNFNILKPVTKYQLDIYNNQKKFCQKSFQMAEQSNLQKLQQLLQQQGIIIHKDVTEQSATMVISFNELHDVAEIIKNYRKMLQKLNLPIKYSNQSQDQANAPYNRQIQEQREQEFFADGSSSSTDHSNENKNKDIKSQMHVHSPANQADPEVDFNSLAQKIKDVLQSDSNIQPQPKKIIQTTYIPLISALQAQMSKLLQELEIVQQKLKEAQQDDPYQQLKRLQDQETNLQEKIYQSLQKFRTLYQSLDSNQKKLKLGKRLLSSKLFFGKQKNLVKIVDYHVLLACKGLYDIKEQPEEDSD